MNCSKCRFHDEDGETFFGTCNYFKELGKESKPIEDAKVYEEGCHFYLKKMVCFECNKEVNFENSDLASAVKGDTDRCCHPCYEKIVQATIEEVKGMQGIVRI